MFSLSSEVFTGYELFDKFQESVLENFEIDREINILHNIILYVLHKKEEIHESVI